MFASLVHRLSILAAGAALVAAVAAPVVVDAAGMAQGSQTGGQITPVLASRADLQVTASGVHTSASGDTIYQFTIKNVGAGTALGVKVTKLSQIRETAQPRRVKNTISVVEYAEIPAGHEKLVTIECEQSERYICTYGSVDVDVDGTESSTANNFAAQSL